MDFLAEHGIAAIPYHGQMDNANAPAQPGALDVRRSARAGGDDRVRPGHQQGGGARGDPLSRCRNRSSSITRRRGARAATGCRRIASLLWQKQGRGPAGLLHRPDARSGGEGARLAALSRGAALRGERHAAGITRSALHFGETPKWERCEMCDVCGNAPEWLDGAAGRSAGGEDETRKPQDWNRRRPAGRA